MRFQEIENAFRLLKICPKCNSKEGFWLSVKHDRPYAYCKGCGAIYEMYEVFKGSEETKAPRRLALFWK